MSVVAAFDVDGTLTTRDCVVPFLQQLRGRAGLYAAMAAQPVALVGAAARRDRDRMKAVAVRAAFRDREVAVVEQLGARFAEHVNASWLRDDTPRRLAWHLDQGHQVVLVSASLGAYLRPLGSLLGVHGVLCTDALAGDDGRYTGELAGPNCRRAEKVARLRRWMGEQDLGDAELWAYGDGSGDTELLAAADHGLLVKGIIVPPSPSTAEVR